MDSSMSPFSTNGNNSSAKYIANKAGSHNEAVIIAGVMIGSVFFVAIVGVAWMFFRERSRKIKDQLAATKTVSASEYVSSSNGGTQGIVDHEATVGTGCWRKELKISRET
ncbi:hypothetical protein F25303_12839 [Fusarium sp. NRRL 25303]|nr:hypothetical protein F25303_12839 [Fusarium sp. NRRL 25303]